MIVVANGAIKSGSTWLYQILRHATRYEAPPSFFHRQGWGDYGVAPRRLADFLVHARASGRNFLFKGHITLKSHLLQNRPDIKVFNITRDIRDAIVSAFYHDLANGSTDTSDFECYYWTRGRNLAKRIVMHHRIWRESEFTCVISFEKLKKSYLQELERIYIFLGIPEGERDAPRLREETSFRSLKDANTDNSKPDDLQFFRRGAVGDWRLHMDEEMVADIFRIESLMEHELSSFEWKRLRALDTVAGRWFD